MTRKYILEEQNIVTQRPLGDYGQHFTLSEYRLYAQQIIQVKDGGKSEIGQEKNVE